MKAERLFRIIGLVDDDLIEELSASFSTPKKSRHWKQYLAAAACLGLMCVLSFTLFMDRGGSKSESAAPEFSGSDGSGVTHDTEPLSVEETTFMSYAGPVFPLTLTEETEGVTAQRTTTWDFTTGTYLDSDESRQWGATVTDSYVLMNHTTGEIIAMACYPVAGSLDSLAEHAPVITADSAKTNWTLYTGSYAGGFRDAGVDDGSTWNLDTPGNWKDYKTLLENGSYLETALSEKPLLEESVIVYSFTDFKAPQDTQNVEQVFSCVYDRDVTAVLSYGFNSLWYDDPGAPDWYQYGYTANRAVKQENFPKYLIVLGEDVRDTALRSLVNGNDEILDDVYCTVKRYETTLGDILEEICGNYREEYLQSWQQHSNTSNTFAHASTEDFCNLVAEQLLQHGLLSDTPKDRYADGRLDELIPETLYFDRVLYLTFPVTIPAGSNITVTVQQWKAPSFDYGGTHSENVDLQGYDLVTRLGSNLDFWEQKAALTNTENMEIAGQNFGFDLDSGITEVTLDLSQEHYYLEIRPKEEKMNRRKSFPPVFYGFFYQFCAQPATKPAHCHTSQDIRWPMDIEVQT